MVGHDLLTIALVCPGEVELIKQLNILTANDLITCFTDFLVPMRNFSASFSSGASSPLFVNAAMSAKSANF
jgi:hypothetical protein